MKIRKYYLLGISFLLFFSLFYSSANSISSVSDLAPNKKNDYTSAQLVANLEQDTSSTPQLSQTVAWDDNGTVICNEDTDDQWIPQICCDDDGGAIITWIDERSGNKDIYAQKIDSGGNTQWGANGTVICNATLEQWSPQICCNDAGGAIITWEDKRSGNNDIYAQKIDTAGDTQWGDGSFWGGNPDRNGTVICNATLDQWFPHICCDGAGGAIITWYDWRSGNCDIYAQKIDSGGNTQWGANGTVICNEDTDHQLSPQICCDDDGGAIITWRDERSGNRDIYAQKINKTGDTQWGNGSFWGGNPDRNGTVICNATLNQWSPQICCVGAGSAIITWIDERNGANWDIYAQKINKTGDTQWGDGSFWGGNPDRNGTVICNEDTQDQRYPQICCDDDGGAIITWEDMRSGANYDIYAQKIDSAGDTQWGDGSFWGGNPDRNGTVICNATLDQCYPQICCDGAGGAITTWYDWRSGNSDIYAQKIDSAGDTKWGDGSMWGGLQDRNGTVICNEDTDDQYDPHICCDGAGGAIITWTDMRSGGANPADIYAQKIKRVSGRLGLALPAADDDDDDDDDTGVGVVIIVVVVLACIGLGVVVMILIKKEIIDVSKLKKR